MEAEGSRLAHQGLHHQLTLPPGIPGLDVVRALHQTIISLRSALDSSREELRRLREIVGDFRGESYVETVERLSLENHVLRRRILDGVKTEAIKDVSISSAEAAARSKLQLSPVLIIEDLSETSQPVMSTVMDTEPENTPKDLDQAESQINLEQPSITEENKDETNVENTSVVVITESPKTLEEITPEVNENTEKESVDVLDAPATSKEIYEPADLLDVPDKDPEDMSLRSVSDGDNSVISENPQLFTPEVKQESENESEELDDIELIFTTEESCRDVGLQEDLVSITDTDHWHGNNSNNNNNNNNDSTTNNNNTGEQPMLVKYKSADEAGVCNGDKTVGSSVDEPVSSQSSSIDREESVDRFDESSNTRLNKMWSQCSVLVETDISKCGVVEEPEHAAKHAARRNTLAAPPTAYR